MEADRPLRTWHVNRPLQEAGNLNVVLPPDDAEYNATSIGLRILERNRIRCQDSALEPRLRAPLDREREHKSRLSRMNENRHFCFTCRCTYSRSSHTIQL